MAFFPVGINARLRVCACVHIAYVHNEGFVLLVIIIIIIYNNIILWADSDSSPLVVVVVTRCHMDFPLPRAQDDSGFLSFVTVSLCSVGKSRHRQKSKKLKLKKSKIKLRCPDWGLCGKVCRALQEG